MKYTILVNNENKFKSSFLKKIELVKTKNINNEEIYLEKETYNAYLKLKMFLQKEKIDIVIVSAYKEYIEKERVISKEEQEHYTGLAIDISLNNSSETQETLYLKLYNNAYKYGFIVCPSQKENNISTNHIRYVGSIPANIMYKYNLTLEEYLKDFGCILYINKPKNYTSYDIVNKISHLFGIKKVGHTGTLDPLAEGVLLIAIGKATKIVELLTAEDKEYIAEAKLGIKTNTYDITGTIIAEKEIPKKINIEKTLESFKKTYMQEVPIYSAVKVKGKKLYEYARKNKQVNLPKKEVTIKNIELLESNKDIFTFKTTVTKGCYIRSLINDIGNSLNTYATMTKLIRIRQGNITLNETQKIEDIEQGYYKLHSIDEILNYPVIKVNKEIEFKIINGMTLNNKWDINDKVIFKNSQDKILGIYQLKEKKLIVWKNLISVNKL